MACYRIKIPPNSPTILQVLPALNTGGIERGTLEIAEAIVAAGGRALVASHGGSLVPKLLRLGARHFQLPLHKKSPFAIWRNSRALSALIARENVDLIHARSRAPAWAAQRAAGTTRVPFVTTWHGTHHENWPGKKRYNRVLTRGVRVIAISQHIAERLRRDYHVGLDRLRLIPRGADVDYFNPELFLGQRVQSLAEAWDIPPDAQVIVLPGRLTRWKGQLLLLEALALLKDTLNQPFICAFIGPANPKERYVRELVNRARKLGIGEQIRFTGLCQDMPAAYAMADVVTVPSLRPEPFGRVIIEAQAMGCPVIVASPHQRIETVIERETGLLVPQNNPSALAAAIKEILTMNEAQKDQAAKDARNLVLARFTIRQMQLATLGVYDEILGTNLASTLFARGST